MSDDVSAPVELTASKETKTTIVRKKERLNLLVGGHVDTGRSTICGKLLLLNNKIDKERFEQYQNEGRQYQYLSRILSGDVPIAQEWKSIENDSIWFDTETKHCVIFDTICYKYFGSDYHARTAQADIAILVISARQGEFERGFECGGQTRDVAMLVKTAGVRYLVVLINKMDDPTVNWDQARYDEIRDKLSTYLKKYPFNSDEDNVFIPCSAISGAFLKEHPGDEVASWYKGPTLIEYLNSLPSCHGSIDGPLRMLIIERYKVRLQDEGVIVIGKIESGTCRVGDKCLIMPNRTHVEVTNIYSEEIETDSCVCGDNIRLKLKNVKEEEIASGFILCDTQQDPCGVGRVFDAQIIIFEYKSIICPGYTATLHIHFATIEVELKKLITLINRKTGERTQEHPRFIKQDQVGIARFELSQTNQMICMERFKHSPQLGRFTLHHEGQTVAMGKILKIIE